ncbi:MAG: VOC family protein [Chloroflexi bacterium]|nr:VOC family protein [Chloroflexota bacterium]
MSASRLVKAQLVLPVRDLPESCAWYARALGMQTVYVHSDQVEDPTGNYAILRRDGAEVHLLRDEQPRPHIWTTAGSGYLFLLVQGLEALCEQVQAAGISLTRGLQREAWGARAFQLTDPSGNLILVAEDLG